MNPYLAARDIGNNISKGYREYKDENAIESILAQSSASGDPAVLQGSISKILSQVSPERQSGALQYLQNAYANVQKKQEQEKAQVLGREAAKQGGFTYGAPPAVQAQQVRNQKPSAAAGGIGGQPVPEQFAMKLRSVLDANKDSTADDLALALDEALIPRAYSNSYIENRRKQNEGPQAGDEYSKLREKNIGEYVNKALSQGEEAENLKFTLEEARKAVQGDVAGPGLTALAKNNPYSQLLTGLTPDEATLQAANKKLLEGSKGIFGSKPTEREIFLLLNSMLPSIGKSMEANIAGLNFIEKINDMKLMHAEIVSELTDGGAKFIPDLERKVNAQMRPYAESLKKEMAQAKEALDALEPEKKKGKGGKIQVTAPDGTIGFMTQEQIDKAKADNVIFTPVKK
jgi:hypothetical protein